MVKKILVTFFFTVFLLLIPMVFYVLDYPQAMAINQENVLYNLPYPGLLPDHPLYIIKAIRDRILDWTTRDYLKKAELYVLYSDKRAAMVTPLVKKGKNKLAIDTMAKAEKYFFEIPKLLTISKKTGVPASSGFINDLKMSNAKHNEIIQSLIKELPQGQDDAINPVLNLNLAVKKDIDKL